MKINTGLPLFNSPVDPQGTENQPYNVIFSSSSLSLTSAVKDVSETAIVVKAYGLTDGNTITVYTVSTDGLGNDLTEPLIINGRTVQLAETSNTLVIDISGKYKFVLSDGLGTVSCVFHESGMSLFSYGLAAYATLNSTFQFIETATILPVVSGVEVRENAKLSAVPGNLLQIQSDGLYYGIQPPPNFANQYVSSSTGSDSNPGTIGFPLQTIQKALSNLPDGTMGTIYLLHGDTFHTYPTASTDVINTLTFLQSVQQSSTLNIGNRSIDFRPYNDTAVDDILAYNVAHSTNYYPYYAAEIDFPTIQITLSLPTDSSTYVPLPFIVGNFGNLTFEGIDFTVGQTGTSDPVFNNGAIYGGGNVSFTGGHITVGNVSALGVGVGGQNQYLILFHVILQDHVVPSTPPLFASMGTRFATNTLTPIAPGSLIVPALTYTDIGDNAETYLATAALWDGLTIFSTAFRSYSNLISSIEIA